MKLRGIEFGNVLGASGVQGFFGDDYWFHGAMKPFGLNFSGMTFVSKTATLLPRKGNMRLTEQYRPRDILPACIKVKPFKGLMLNSVGLSNPGIGLLLGTGRWQSRTEPFLISVMTLAGTTDKRLEELRIIIDTIGFEMDKFSAKFCIQINLSCPNTEHDPSELIAEVAESIEIASSLGVPIMPKFSIASAPIQAIMELNSNPNCDAICVSNTLPFGWNGVGKDVWGSKISPLEKLGGGGLSGKVLLPLVCEWITRLRDAGFTKPINGGGGILCSDDVYRYHEAGASSIFLGSVALLRPWRVEEIINHANNLTWKE